MRYRAPFTLVKVTHKSGTVVYYYRTYDENNRRTTAKSTGCISKSAARAVCNELYKNGKLIPSAKGDMTLEKYCKDWWIIGKCDYLNSLERRGGKITKKYAQTMRQSLDKHVLPKFGKYKLGNISPGMIEKWLYEMQDTGLAHGTLNAKLLNLRIILDEAVRNNYIKINPAANVKRLVNRPKARSIMTNQEVQRIFDPVKVGTIWQTYSSYAANLLSSCTGMRLGEVRAISAEDIHDDYIHVYKSYSNTDGLKDTKTHDERKIPIPPFLIEVLDKLKRINPQGYLFSLNGGLNPPNEKDFTNDLYKAMYSIGILDTERKERFISFHSWRHFFNTSLRSANISDGKVQKLTGHKTLAMTEHYTHFDVNDLRDITKVQEAIFGNA